MKMQYYLTFLNLFTVISFVANAAPLEEDVTIYLCPNDDSGCAEAYATEDWVQGIELMRSAASLARAAGRSETTINVPVGSGILVEFSDFARDYDAFTGRLWSNFDRDIDKIGQLYEVARRLGDERSMKELWILKELVKEAINGLSDKFEVNEAQRIRKRRAARIHR